MACITLYVNALPIIFIWVIPIESDVTTGNGHHCVEKIHNRS